jgi:hypothetical protein
MGALDPEFAFLIGILQVRLLNKLLHAPQVDDHIFPHGSKFIPRRRKLDHPHFVLVFTENPNAL